MRNVLAVWMMCMCSLVAVAQPKGYSAVKNVAAFQQSLQKASASVQTIQSDFDQVKNLSLLQDKIKSKGKFYLKKEDKVRIEYTSPFSYLVVMNAGQVLVKDEQKTNKVNTRNSKTMQSVNRIMLDCMRGTVLSNPDFRTAVFESGQSYLVSLTPATDAMKKMFRQIDVYMDKKSFDVRSLSMVEQGGDFTDMDFRNTQHNVSLNDALFKVK
ncbi:MAG: outer membrane lipoprotein carrier protein LolA [Flavipsychrobacter sp.]|nr:outer membrane lipoprotein carrier protein LolA [Flavipsychrobacter sp.]